MLLSTVLTTVLLLRQRRLLLLLLGTLVLRMQLALLLLMMMLSSVVSRPRRLLRGQRRLLSTLPLSLQRHDVLRLRVLSCRCLPHVLLLLHSLLMQHGGLLVPLHSMRSLQLRTLLPYLSLLLLLLLLWVMVVLR
ncbi:hypothetical protein JKP88DRAFT_214401 [Tribonema minus]|uniref:Uncharacterized protein n=1 Tax=Tribonema minus TaxID=303371 RepID=A0A836CRN9_9STRA|nr:hypothetical protein JKP88DRAFT_214401 [Tribonema minus]